MGQEKLSTELASPSLLGVRVLKGESMKYRKNNWLDTTSMQIKYGIDAFYKGEWLHCSDNGKPVFFDNEADRDAKLKELRKAP